MKNFQTSVNKHDRLRQGVIIVGALLSIALLIAGVLLLRTAFSPAAQTENIEPATPGEFLILVAPFQHQGGKAYDFGAELANDLRQAPHNADDYRVADMAHAPDENEIPELVQSYHPRVIVTGAYDETNIDAWVYFIPPETLPPELAQTEGSFLLFSDLKPERYHIYAPRGLGNPLQYLQYWIIGQSQFWAGDDQRAVESFELAQQMEPSVTPVNRRAEMDRFTSTILRALGYIIGPVRGDWPVARDFYYRAFTLDPDSLGAALGLAASLTQLNELDKATDILQAVLREHPDAWQVYFALAEIKAQQGQKEEALALYEQAINILITEKRPEFQQALADVYFSRGYYYYQQGDFASALADYQQAQALGRKDVYLLSNLGWTAYLLGDYDAAAEASSEAAALAPEQPDLAFNKALHLLAAGRYDEAKEAYNEAIQLTLQYDDVLIRSRYFGVAYHDLEELASKRPDLQPIIQEIQNEIDIANG